MGRQRVEPSTGPPKQTKCFKCKQIGHYRSECPEWAGSRANAPQDGSSTRVVLGWLEIMRSLLPLMIESSVQANGSFGPAKLESALANVVRSAAVSGGPRKPLLYADTVK